MRSPLPKLRACPADTLARRPICLPGDGAGLRYRWGAGGTPYLAAHALDRWRVFQDIACGCGWKGYCPGGAAARRWGAVLMAAVVKWSAERW